MDLACEPMSGALRPKRFPVEQGQQLRRLRLWKQEPLNQGSIALETLGGILSVSCVREDSAYRNIWLTGPVMKVFKGEFQ